MIKLKRCSNPKCKSPLKPESEFTIDRSTSDGLNRRCKECKNEYWQKNKQRMKDIRIERKYAILPGNDEMILKSQDYKCFICREVKSLVHDHDHITGKFRSFLCEECNIRVGLYENHPVIEYLDWPHWEFLLSIFWPTSRNDRDQHLRDRYNIYLGDYDMMFKAQNGVSGICSKVCATRYNLCVDHDHQTLRVRGLLCASCNSKLGKNDNHDILGYIHHFSNN